MNNNNFLIIQKMIIHLLNSQKTIIYFLCIYFGYRIFYQILGKVNNNNFNDNNEIIYFSTSSILLIFF